MIILQLALYCALFTLMVKVGVGNNALNGLYFYPKPVQEKVYELGLTDRKTVCGSATAGSGSSPARKKSRSYRLGLRS